MIKCVIVFVSVLFQVITTGQGQSDCLARYRKAVEKKDFIGKPAETEIIETFDHGNILVRYKCPESYELKGEWEKYGKDDFLIHCSYYNDDRFLQENVWPICRGPYENVTCTNEYQTWNTSFGKPWLKPTHNLVHAYYSPMKYSYGYNYQLTFHCPGNMMIHRSIGSYVMTSKCKKDGGWTVEWPLCQGDTCPVLSIQNGKILNAEQRYDVGTVLRIQCSPGYFLWGSEKITCLNNLKWSDQTVGCITYTQYQRYCKQEGRKLEVTYDQYKGMILKCYTREVTIRAAPTKITTELAVAVGIPLCFIFTLMIVVSIYIRHKRERISRDSIYLDLPNGRGETISFMLPTYAQAMKTKPTTPPPTFNETFGIIADESNAASSFLTPSEEEQVVPSLPPIYDAETSRAEEQFETQEQAPPSYHSESNLQNINEEIT